MGKLHAGTRLRRLRVERGLSQVELARLLSISPSYLNQIEHDVRPLSATVLVQLIDVLNVDPVYFAAQDTARVQAELREALLSVAGTTPPPVGDIKQVAEAMPEVAEAIIELHRRHRDSMVHLASVSDNHRTNEALLPHERVRDFFYGVHNYVDTIDRAAETLAIDIGTRPFEVHQQLRMYLASEYGIRVVVRHDVEPGSYQFDRDTRTLTVSGHLTPGQQSFRMATQLAYEAAGDELEEVLGREEWPDNTTRRLARIALARHFAGAFVLPYQQFFHTAEQFKYDVEALSDHFGMGYEVVAHRLSTLQRPGLTGVPFIFVRMDRAGNISQRQSAVGFHFTRGITNCPLWNVYDAFYTPGRVNVQIAELPDGRRYLWVARTVTHQRGGYRGVGKTLVVGLGCELRQADRLIYSRGLDLATPEPDLIGPGCHRCERRDCPQRSAPLATGKLDVEETGSGFVPYPLREEQPLR